MTHSVPGVYINRIWKREIYGAALLGGLVLLRQLSTVMVLPQRGHIEPPEAQVVPQLEQVLTLQQVLPFAFFAGQLTQPPAAAVVVPEGVAVSSGQTSVKAQEDCGNSGSEKNSSQTDSANSSQGGAWQKP